MSKHNIVLTLVVTLLLLLSSCNLARGTTDVDPDDGTTGDPVADQETLVALAVQQTQAAAGPILPDFTFTPSPSPTITLTITPEVPRVTVSQATNCRTGPGEPYDIVGVLPVGTPAEVVGKNAYGDTWIIKLPSNPAVTCWLWGQWGTVEGNTAGLTVYSPPPTPTPAITYTVNFLSTIICAPQYAFRFNITNNGSLTWQSIQIVITDNTTSTTFTHTLDAFRSYDGCAFEMSNLDLEPSETGTVANVSPGQLNYNPAGHNFAATFRLCSEDGLAGTCLDKSISFTP